jgi:hypothetical protein
MGFLNYAKLSAERVKLLGEFAFPNGGRFIALGPVLIGVKSRKQIVLPGDGSEELADAPVLGEAWREKASA